ncbi:hypothetical protein [Acinetobacter bereziniae]|nr:hypothetical protein [Acinetobacter bereziniae]
MTLLVARLLAKVVAPMPLLLADALLELILKSVGSINQVPVFPLSDRVDTAVV